MRRIAVALFAIALSSGDARAQSVSETLTTLSNRINSPLVMTRSDASGGQIYVMDSSQKTVSVQLRTDKDGGNIDLYPRTGGRSAYMGTRGKSGELYLYSQTGTESIELGSTDQSIGFINLQDTTGKYQSSVLNAYGLFLMDGTGAKQLASFAKTTDGKSVVVSVNGTRVHDYAEVFDLAEHNVLDPGSVVAASPDGKGIKLSGGAYDPAVVGVISGAGTFQPGMRIGSREDGSSNSPVAVSGQVYVRVSAEAGAIAVGDLLVSSSVSGVAMRGSDKTRLTGTVIGKALQPYSGQGESLIRMLVMVR